MANYFPPAQPPARPAAKRGLGDADPIGKTVNGLTYAQKVMLGVHGVVLLGVAFHGYKRNRNSVPWGLSWAMGGLLCPTVTLAFALTQGFADTAKKE